MYAVQLRGEGLKNKEISEKLSIDKRMISKYVSLYRKGGIKSLENQPRSERPTVPCHHIREYRYAYGAVEPMTGDGFFLVMPYCNTDCMNLFLQELSKKYSDDFIVLACDGARWHKSNTLQIPENIELVFISPYTPEMNPIEQIWEELREKGFKNQVFQTLDKAVERLCDVICNLTSDTIKSITGRDWILSI